MSDETKKCGAGPDAYFAKYLPLMCCDLDAGHDGPHRDAVHYRETWWLDGVLGEHECVLDTLAERAANKAKHLRAEARRVKKESRR